MSDSDLNKKLEQYNDDFFEFCQERNDMGAEEYGPTNFLNVDLPEFIYEEMADLANYARFLYIKLRLMEEIANERGINLSAAFTGEVPADEVPSNTPSFVPKQQISGFLPDKK